MAGGLRSMACLKVLGFAFGLGVFFPDSELAFFSIFRTISCILSYVNKFYLPMLLIHKF